MKRRVQAFVMAFLLLFATIAAPVLDAGPVNAAEDSLEIMFHYNREDGAYDNWYLYTWGGETTGDVEFKDVDGEKVATVVAGSSATSIGFIVKTELGWDNAVKDWNGDRSVDVTNYASGEIHVYIESGVEEVTVDYTKAIEKSADEMEEDETEDGEGLQIVFDYTRPDGDYGTWGLWLWDDIGTNAIYPLFEADEDGKMVLTKLNEELLQQIAEATEGIYTRSRNEDFGLEGIVERLNQIEASELTEITFAEYDEEYQWFLGVALLLLVAEAIILPRRNPLLRGVKLFERNEQGETHK